MIALGLGALCTGAYMNLVSRLSRAREERGLKGIHDEVTREMGPPTWRIGGWILVVATPLVLLASWMTDRP